MNRPELIQLAYLLSVVLFVFGLKRLSHPKTARGGNALASLAMLVAIVATLLHQDIVSFPLIVAGIVVGSAVGAVLAYRIEMTAMPQLVALFNGFGGLASAVIGLSEFLRPVTEATEAAPAVLSALPLEATALTIALSVLIGALTFTGSLVAFGKLQGLKITPSAPVVFPGRNIVNAVLVLGAFYLTAAFAGGSFGWQILLLLIVSLALGILLVIPIGGADMPVVISLLNSYSGMAACATGFVLENQLLIVAGALVGASGLILTQIMCKAMNRSLTNVVMGGFGGVAATAGKTEKRSVTDYDAYDAATVLEAAQSVVIVPGYGLAVAQAQHAVRELETKLEGRGTKVRYAIHPVAGRMPGHMNVLLAEADVPYEKLVEMDDINPELPQTDVALVLGANDVINPAARDDPGSPIYGMPILEVDKAATVMIVKRSLSPGYAGIDNELFYSPKTMMLFGDAKKMVHDLLDALE